MKKILKIAISLILLGIINTGLIVYFSLTKIDKTPHEKFENLGYIVHLADSSKYTKEAPTVILVTGSGGGFWGKSRKYHIDKLLKDGYNVIRIAYMKIDGVPNSFKRIELGSFSRIMDHIHQKHPQIDTENVAIIGISKGTEFVLNVSSRVRQFKTVVAIVPSFVTFQGREIGGESQPYSSFQLNEKELPFVPLPSSSFLGYETIWSGELNLFNAGLMNNPQKVEEARIPVENINAPILLISGKYDQIWPSFLMATEIENRLADKDYLYNVEHHAINSNHFVLRDDGVWDIVMDFLESNFKNKTIPNNLPQN